MALAAAPTASQLQPSRPPVFAVRERPPRSQERGHGLGAVTAAAAADPMRLVMRRFKQAAVSRLAIPHLDTPGHPLLTMSSRTNPRSIRASGLAAPSASSKITFLQTECRVQTFRFQADTFN